MTKAKKAERDEAIAHLREIIKPGSTVYTVLRKRAASGMSRNIAPVIFIKDEPLYLYYWIGLALGLTVTPDESVRVTGCGMDMGFHLVYELSRVLFPQGFECVGEGCPSNDHSNGDRDYTPGHCTHQDGGYALRQRWL